MIAAIPWHRRLGVKLDGIAFAFLAISLLFIAGDYFLLSTMRGDTATIILYGRGRNLTYKAVYLAQRLFVDAPNDRGPILEKLNKTTAAMDARLATLLNGDTAAGMPPAPEPVQPILH